MPTAIVEYNKLGARRIIVNDIAGQWTGYEFAASVHVEIEGTTYVHFSEYWEGELPTNSVCRLTPVETVERGKLC